MYPNGGEDDADGADDDDHDGLREEPQSNEIVAPPIDTQSSWLLQQRVSTLPSMC